MSKTKKIVLGMATLWPILYMFIFAIVFFLLAKNAINPQGIFGYLIGMHFLTMLLIVILLVIYIRDIFKNNAIIETRKTLWTLIILF